MNIVRHDPLIVGCHQRCEEADQVQRYHLGPGINLDAKKRSRTGPKLEKAVLERALFIQKNDISHQKQCEQHQHHLGRHEEVNDAHPARGAGFYRRRL